MTSQGSAHGRFQRAIHRRHLFAAEMAAREMHEITLADALALTVLIGEENPARYDRAAARWHMRFVREANGIDLRESQLVLAALAALRGPTAATAAATLVSLGRSFGVTGLDAALRDVRDA
jgi:hypothetical protein